MNGLELGRKCDRNCRSCIHVKECTGFMKALHKVQSPHDVFDFLDNTGITLAVREVVIDSMIAMNKVFDVYKKEDEQSM